MNIGLALSRNFQKVTCDLVNEIIEHESEAELKAKVRQKFDMIKGEIELQFEKLGVKT